MHRDHRFASHRHRSHELLWGTTGRFTVTTDESLWHVPPLMGVLVPGDLPHGGDGAAGVRYVSTRFDARRFSCDWSEPTLVHVPQAASALLLHVQRRPDLPEPIRARSVRVAFDLLEPAWAAVPVLPRPADPRALAVVDALSADPADQRTIEDWGRAVGASARTLARTFRAETGLTFGQWRANARVAAAMTLLAGGASVSSVARRVGYQTASAFVRAFRLTTGRVPTAWTADITAARESAPDPNELTGPSR